VLICDGVGGLFGDHHDNSSSNVHSQLERDETKCISCEEVLVCDGVGGLFGDHHDSSSNVPGRQLRDDGRVGDTQPTHAKSGEREREREREKARERLVTEGRKPQAHTNRTLPDDFQALVNDAAAILPPSHLIDKKTLERQQRHETKQADLRERGTERERDEERRRERERERNRERDEERERADGRHTHFLLVPTLHLTLQVPPKLYDGKANKSTNALQ
jgi:hypothetical protein